MSKFIDVQRYRHGAAAVVGILLAAAAQTAGARADTTTPASPAPASGAAAADVVTADSVPTGTQLIGPGGPGGMPRVSVRRKAADRFGHLPIIDVVPIFTQPLFVTSNPDKNSTTSNVLDYKGTGYDSLDVGGTIKFPITPNFSASLDRGVGGTLDTSNAPVTNAPSKTGAQTYHYNAVTRDVVLNYRLDEQFHRLLFEEGLNFRHRVATGGGTASSDPNSLNSTEGHYGYVGVTYAAPAIPWLHNSVFSFNINADAQNIDHHVGCGDRIPASPASAAYPCPAGMSVIDENPSRNRYWGTDQFVQLTVPVERRAGVTFNALFHWGATTFFENNPTPSVPLRFSTIQIYTITKRFNRFVALTLREKQQYGTDGYPYYNGNALHTGDIDVFADFKVDTNNLRNVFSHY
jgi:hypothetical protein